MPDTQFFLEIQQGLKPGYSTVEKFGEGINIDSADGFVDLWDGANTTPNLNTYTFSTTADITKVSSSSAGDTQVVEIQGLDTNWNLVVQNATLNGQNKVTLSTALVRVFRIKNKGTTTLAGNVYVYVDGAITAGVPDTSADVRAICQAGLNQTLMAIYAVPAGKTAYLIEHYASTAKAITAVSEVHFSIRPFGGIFQLKHTRSISTTGSSTYSKVYQTLPKYSEKTDIIMSADASANDVAISAGFDLLLVNNRI